MTTQTLCTHCGDACEDGVVSDGEHSFCCAGCLSVYQILNTHNMCEYYALDPDAGVSLRLKKRDSSAYAIVDEPENANNFISWSNGSLKRARFVIPQMHCASCIWLLDQLHRFDEGINSSEVDFLRKTVIIEFDSSKTKLSSLITLLSSLGYEPLLHVEGGEQDVVAKSKSNLRGLYARIGVAGFAAANIMMFSISRYLAGGRGVGADLENLFSVLSVTLSIPVLLYCASPWYTSAFGSLRRKKINLDVPVAMGISVLFVRSMLDMALNTSEGFLDSFAGLVLFLLVGRLFQQKAFDSVVFNRTFRSFFPLSVRVRRKTEEYVVPIGTVEEGDELIVRNGEVVPCDSVLTSTGAYLDYSFVTGESVPIECAQGQLIHAGGKVVGKAIVATATRKASHSYLASLWEKFSRHTERKTYLQLSDRFATRFTLLATLIALIGFLVWLPNLNAAFNVFTSVLIIACPCALTIAAPVTLGTAMSALGLRGIFVKDTGTLLELAKVDTIVFDKTGTLTKPLNKTEYSGQPLSETEQQAVRMVASNSTHPVSIAIAQQEPSNDVSNVVEKTGIGIWGRALNHDVHISAGENGRTSVSINDEHKGSYSVVSEFREGIPEMIGRVRREYTARVATGDGTKDLELLKKVFTNNELKFRLSPTDKVELLESMQSSGKTVLMVGDGLNDAGAMKEANVSIAVSADSSTLVPACDVIMHARKLSALDLILKFSRKMTFVIQINLVFTVFYNALGLYLAVTGVLTPVITAIMMPLSSLMVVGLSVGGARLYAKGLK